MPALDGLQECGHGRAAKTGVVVHCKLLFGLIQPKNTIGLEGMVGRNWHSPESIGFAVTCDDHVILFQDVNMELGE